MLPDNIKFKIVRGTIRITIFCVALLLVSFSSAFAVLDLHVPLEGNSQVLKLTDGSTLIGRILQVDENSVQFEISSGILTILISRIEEIKEVSAAAFKGGKYWFENPNQTRLYLSPTGRSLKKGQGRLRGTLRH